MKVTIRNLGIIKNEATIDLKPLTIFIGPNNTGKTWLAYALAGILGPYGSSRFINAYTEDQLPDTYKPLNDAIEQVLAEGSATIDLHHFADKYGETYFNDVAKLAQEWMSRFLSTQRVRFADLDISLSLEETKTQFLQQISVYSGRNDVATGSEGSLLTIQKRRGEDKLYIFTSTETQDTEKLEEQIGEKIPLDEVKLRLIRFVSIALRRSLYPQIYTFPTDRITFVNFSFSGKGSERGQPFQMNEKIRAALETLVKELEDIKTQTGSAIGREGMQPEGSFLSMMHKLFTVGTREREQREKSANSNPRIRKYIQIADVLEKQILTGNIEFSTPEPDPKRELLFQPTQDISLELPITSSIVKELSPLVLYLRYLARPGELLIIDEPEMNLHPEAQAQITELLTMLVNAGLNVLFTTHSPYITDHLANLIKAAQSEDKEAIRDEFYLKHTDAFIPKEKVSVYGFSEGNVQNILDEDGLISWDTFGKVSKRIINIYFKL